MKTFTEHLYESDYKRFLKKNKNLSKAQINKLNDFYKKVGTAATEFEKTFGWQSPFPQTLTWEDFEKFNSDYTYWVKQNLKDVKIKGTKGKDYWPIRLRTKKYIANIPLNWETAQYMNSCNYGTINVNYCIGWSDNKSFWNDHVIDEQKVPIYITNGSKKWVVMIRPNNISYEVWDKLNKEDISSYNPEPIPDFSIRKELLGKQKANLYNEIRDKFFTNEYSPQYSL